MTDRPDAAPRRWLEHTVAPDEAGRTVRDIVTGALGVSGRMVQRLTRAQGILLNRRPAFLAGRVKAGDVVAVRASEDEAPVLSPVAMDLAVAHEDRDALVVDKPPFLLVHPIQPGQDRTLAHGVAHHLLAEGVHARVRPVHRLDRDTSGLVLFAKSAYAHQHLDRQLRERTLQRRYLALVAGTVAGEAGEIDAPIGRHKANPTLRAVRPAAGEPALTRWRVVERLPAATVLELELVTGRTHQARVHLAHAGHPIAGDRPYGGPALPGLRRQALHASRLVFRVPSTGEEVAVASPLPADLAAARARLGGSPG